MRIYTGLSYHIDDKFYRKVNNKGLMSNRKCGQYRPHFFCIQDKHNPDIFWAIPQSSKVIKYQKIINDKIKKYGRCDNIVIGTYGGKQNAFLIQNMFPVISKYVTHEHTISGNSILINRNLHKLLESKVNKVLSLHKQGVKVLFSDINSIYNQMLRELSIHS